MNRWVMAYLAFALQREGFAVQTLSYRTMRGTLAEHLARVAGRIARALEAPRLHLVGHSLGGVIVLRYLQRGADPRVQRAVLARLAGGGLPRGGRPGAERRAASCCWGQSLGVWREPVDVSVDPRFEVGAIAGTVALGLGAHGDAAAEA